MTSSGPTAAAATIAFSPVRRRRVFEDICEQIRTKLARGDYRPGDKLPTERDLAAELGVGRPAVREALRTLENAGVLMLRKGLRGGAFVRDGDPGTVTQSLQDLINLGHMTLLELMEARRVIVGSVLPLACARGTGPDFDAIEETIDRSEALDAQLHYEDKLIAGTEFFRAIAAASHNKVLILLVESLTVIVRQAALEVRPASNPQTDPSRRAMVRCMRKRDVAGAQAHMDHFFDVVTGEFQQAMRQRGIPF